MVAACILVFHDLTAVLLGLAKELGCGLSMEITMTEINDALALADQVQSLTGLELFDDHVVGLQQFGFHLRDNR